MGRPKGSKNKKTQVMDVVYTEKKSSKEGSLVKVVAAEKTYKTTTVCDICGTAIHCSPVNINLTCLTGKDAYHRKCDKDRLNVCDKCANEMSVLIDDYIIKKNKKRNKFNME